MANNKQLNKNYTPAHRVSSAMGGIKKLLETSKPLKKEALDIQLRSILGILSPAESPKLLIDLLTEKSDSFPDYLLVRKQSDLQEIREFWGQTTLGNELFSDNNFEIFISANFAITKKDIKHLKSPLRIKGKLADLYSTMYAFFVEFNDSYDDLRWIITNIACKSFEKLQNHEPLSVYSNMKKYHTEAEMNDKRDHNSRRPIK